MHIDSAFSCRAPDECRDERLVFAIDQAERCADPGDLATFLHDIEGCTDFQVTEQAYFQQTTKRHTSKPTTKAIHLKININSSTKKIVGVTSQF